MSDEDYLVNESLRLFQTIKVDRFLAPYFEFLPKAGIEGLAQHHVRQYFKQTPRSNPLSEEEKKSVSERICILIVNELLQRDTNPKGSANVDLDGAALFYRRALNHISRERFADAERMLRQAVEIYPRYLDAWEVLGEVCEKNGKSERAMQARLVMRELKREADEAKPADLGEPESGDSASGGS